MKKWIVSLSAFALAYSNLLAAETFTIEEKWRKSYVNSDASNSYPTEFTSFNNQIFFVASDGGNAAESDNRHLYKLNPSTDQFSLITNLDGSATSSVSTLKVFQQKLFFKQGEDTYSLDANFTIKPETTSVVLKMESAVSINGKTYFVADLGLGKELYQLTQNSAELINDFNSGEGDGVISKFAVFNQAVYFSATSGNSQDLYKLDPISNVITNITNYQAQHEVEVSSVTTANNQLFFTQAANNFQGSKVIKYDGSALSEVFYKGYARFDISGAGDDLILKEAVVYD